MATYAKKKTRASRTSKSSKKVRRRSKPTAEELRRKGRKPTAPKKATKAKAKETKRSAKSKPKTKRKSDSRFSKAKKKTPGASVRHRTTPKNPVKGGKKRKKATIADHRGEFVTSRRAAKPKAKRRAAKPKAKAKRLTRAQLEARLRKLERERQKSRTKTGKKKTVAKKRKAQVARTRRELEKHLVVSPPQLAPTSPTPNELREHALAVAQEHLHKLVTEATRKGKRLVPKIKRKREFETEGTAGDQVTLRIGLELTEDSVEETLYRIEQASLKLPGKLPLWLATFFFTAMGERLVGSPKMQEIRRIEGVMLQELIVDSSGIFRSRDGMLAGSRSLLEGLVDRGHRFTLIYLHQVQIKNYGLKP